jgi:glucose-1-phosphate cytidylyltransferase
MKVVILAGGLGTRLSELTEYLPKPMVKIGGKPILWHIMKTYNKHGLKNFFIAAGYKSEIIKEYFLNYRNINSDFTINLKTGNTIFHEVEDVDWTVTVADTGLNSMTGGRVKRMKKYINNETFLLTYGDGLVDIDIKSLIEFHKKHKKMVTVSAVHPGARFGELELKGDHVISFKEKPQTNQGWINGGYFVCEPSFLDLIENDQTILEKEPLENVAKMGQLRAYHHKGFWHCMDTKRDKEVLENLWISGRAPWK